MLSSPDRQTRLRLWLWHGFTIRDPGDTQRYSQQLPVGYHFFREPTRRNAGEAQANDPRSSETQQRSLRSARGLHRRHNTERFAVENPASRGTLTILNPVEQFTTRCASRDHRRRPFAVSSRARHRRHRPHLGCHRRVSAPPPRKFSAGFHRRQLPRLGSRQPARYWCYDTQRSPEPQTTRRSHNQRTHRRTLLRERFVDACHSHRAGPLRCRRAPVYVVVPSVNLQIRTPSRRAQRCETRGRRRSARHGSQVLRLAAGLRLTQIKHRLAVASSLLRCRSRRFL